MRFKFSAKPTALLTHSNKTLHRLSWLTILLFLLALVALANSNFKETEKVRGALKPVAGLQKILAPSAYINTGARVTRILVNQGQQVEKGQILAELSNISFDSEGRPNLEIELARLRELAELVDEELRLKEYALNRTIVANQQSREILTESRRSLRRQLDLVGSRLESSEEHIEALRILLDSKAINRVQFDQQQGVHLGLAIQKEQLQQQFFSLTKQLDELSLAKDMAVLENQNSKLQLLNESKRISFEIDRLTNSEINTVVAQSDADVAALAVAEGESIRAGQVMFYLADPGESDLQAELYVSSRIQGRVEPGQRIMLAYDGFNYQSYGRYEATVTGIGEVALDPREHMLPVSAQQGSLFRVVAALDQQFVEGPEIYRLQRDMEVSAEFVVAEMSLLGFIFKPLLAMKGKIL